MTSTLPQGEILLAIMTIHQNVKLASMEAGVDRPVVSTVAGKVTRVTT